MQGSGPGPCVVPVSEGNRVVQRGQIFPCCREAARQMLGPTPRDAPGPLQALGEASPPRTERSLITLGPPLARNAAFPHSQVEKRRFQRRCSSGTLAWHQAKRTRAWFWKLGAACRGTGLVPAALAAHTRPGGAGWSHAGRGTNHAAPARSAPNPRCLPAPPSSSGTQGLAAWRPARGHRSLAVTVSPVCHLEPSLAPPAVKDAALFPHLLQLRGLGHQNHQLQPLPASPHAGSGPHTPRNETNGRGAEVLTRRAPS